MFGGARACVWLSNPRKAPAIFRAGYNKDPQNIRPKHTGVESELARLFVATYIIKNLLGVSAFIFAQLKIK